MNKYQWLMATAIGLALAGSASAASISNLNGQSCGDLSGTWHFVNNQTGGTSTPGTLNASWSSGDTCSVTASAVNQNTQHFFCSGSGALTGATTNLPGRLLLSDFTCEKKCDDPKYCK